jgi:hypothetical protein
MKIVDNVLTRVDFEDIVDGTFSIPINVVAIDEKAFIGNRKIESIVIPGNVKSIGWGLLSDAKISKR